MKEGIGNLNGHALAGAMVFALAGTVMAGDCTPQWDHTVGQPGFGGDQGDVMALATFDGKVYAGGHFTADGNWDDPTELLHIAVWDGSEWSQVGGGMNDRVSALVEFDDGSGPALYAGGSFTQAGGQSANRVAKWDGNEWSSLGSSPGGTVNNFIVFNDGSGDALYAAGTFDGRIAKWDGQQWSTVGGGVSGGVIRAVATFDDGSGPALYVGGNISEAGGVPVNYIAKWDGEQWSALGDGTDGQVASLQAFDDGSGPALFVGGDFESAGGQSVEAIAKWDGTSWSPVSDQGIDDWVRALHVFDDGSGDGPALYAAGNFGEAGGIDADYVAKWDGTEWSELDGGLADTASVLASANYGGYQYLFIGGAFFGAGGETANNIAGWRGCELPCDEDLDGNGQVNVFDLLDLLGQWGTCPRSVRGSGSCPADFTGDNTVNVFDLLELLGAWGSCN